MFLYKFNKDALRTGVLFLLLKKLGVGKCVHWRYLGQILNVPLCVCVYKWQMTIRHILSSTAGSLSL